MLFLGWTDGEKPYMQSRSFQIDELSCTTDSQSCNRCNRQTIVVQYIWKQKFQQLKSTLFLSFNLSAHHMTERKQKRDLLGSIDVNRFYGDFVICPGSLKKSQLQKH